jgi:anti-sigma B factor antagonist
MPIKESIWDDVAVLALQGRFMGGQNSLALHEKVHSLIDDGVKQVVMDLKETEWMNSSALGVLIASITSLRNAGGDLKLAQVAPKIESLLYSTKLISVFETYESVDAAVASFLR